MKKFALLALTFFSTFSVLTAAEKITVTFLHPPGKFDSKIQAGSASLQFGQADLMAGYWQGTAASFKSLHPPGYAQSNVYVFAAGQLGGYAQTMMGSNHAGFWSSVAASFTDLHPALIQIDGGNFVAVAHSYVQAITGNIQAGMVFPDMPQASPVAAIWQGSPASVVNLNPTVNNIVSTESWIYAASGDQQGGYATFNGKNHAGLWTKTKSSFVDLNPPGMDSSRVFGMTPGQQVGYAFVNNRALAAMWTGAANSFRNLDPDGPYLGSILYATMGTRQVGATNVSGNFLHAGIWAGTAASFTDLHALLPIGYNNSIPTSVWTDGTSVFVGGYAHNTAPARDEAVLWTLTPGPPTVKISGRKKIITAKSSVLIKGTTTGSVTVVKVKIGKKSVTAKGTAAWKVKASHLKPGKTKVTVTATGPGGASAPARLTIVRKP